MSDTIGLWTSVDALTRPTTMRIHRDALEEADLAAVLLHDLSANPRRTRCSVAEYHRAHELAAGQERGHGTIPPLVEQAQAAVTGQGDNDDTSGAVLGRERSVADLALMETLFTLRELLAAEIRDHRATPRTSLLAQIRQVASLIAADGDDETITWWTWRLDQWGWVIANQLNAVDNGPRPFRLRDSQCPRCGARQTRVREQGEWRLVPPLRIDFREGMVRAATCSGCGHAWMRGDGLRELGDTLGRSIIANNAESA